ncbi:MAG: DUF1289 domain-containing protein [Pseudomonadota bacterium]
MNSPCVQFCQIDQVTGLCSGCSRSLDEIAGWTGFSEEQRAEIIADLPGRRAAEGQEGGE